jgi:nucleoside-triphosphatase
LCGLFLPQKCESLSNSRFRKHASPPLCNRATFRYNFPMEELRKNVFLTGAPSSGKTSVIKKVIARLSLPANGFYTEEERIGGKRVGFVMRTLDGRKASLARQDIKSDFHIRRYGVSIENIETVAVPSIAPVGGNVIILDEIGKMECFSDAFKTAAIRALDSSNIVIGTITFGGGAFITGIKNRRDLEINEVTPENRDSLPDLILEKILEIVRYRSA